MFHVHIPEIEDGTNLFSEEADELFGNLMDTMCDGVVIDSLGDETESVRLGVTWVMQYNLACLELLLESGHIPRGGDGFFRPSAFRDDINCMHPVSISLLGIASRDLCAPDAVRVILEHGADPNGVLNRRLDGGIQCGPAALASLDADGDWTLKKWTGRTFVHISPAPTKKMEVLTLLVDAGGSIRNDASPTGDWYDKKKHETQYKVEQALHWKQAGRESHVALIRFENVVALNGIISFWRRAAAAPGSIAARNAIRRAQKSAQLT